MTRHAERTSLSHPLGIDEVPCGGGVLGLTLCPGKVAPSYAGAPWRRDLDLDLDRVRAWGAEVVVTLTEEAELRALSVPTLGEGVRARGMDWLHLPIVDGQAPGATFERRWAVFGTILRARLERGGRVLIHCRGGLGRAGTVAARLLVEFGAEPSAAIAAVRAARRGAIETRGQEAYLQALKPFQARSSRADKLVGCLLAGAVGDAFGYAVEFIKLRDILRTYGPSGLTEPQFRGGKLVVSDDTQMTLFTAEGLVRAWRSGRTDADAVVEAIRASYLDWFATQEGGAGEAARRPGALARYRELWFDRAAGTTCKTALSAGGAGAIERPINNSKGCGGVMRVAPIGLLTQLTPAEAFIVAARAAALTHGHPLGYLSAGALAYLLRLLAAGAALTAAAEAAIAHLATWDGADELIALLRRALALAGDRSEEPRAAVAGLGLGWVGEEALAVALYAAVRSESLIETLILSANHDGDSDSTASIAGQIWGAAHGVEGLPLNWIAALDVLDPLGEVIDGLERLNADFEATHDPAAFARREGFDPHALHVAAVHAWVEANTRRYANVAEVRLTDFKWNEGRALDVDFTAEFLPGGRQERLAAYADGAGQIWISAPMFVSPMGAPASFPAVEFDAATGKALLAGVRAVIPPLAPFGIDPKTGRHLDASTPLNGRMPDLAGVRKRLGRAGLVVLVDVSTGLPDVA